MASFNMSDLVNMFGDQHNAKVYGETTRPSGWTPNNLNPGGTPSNPADLSPNSNPTFGQVKNFVRARLEYEFWVGSQYTS